MSLDTVALQSSPYERSMPKNMPNNYGLLQIAHRVFVGKFGTFVAKIDSGLQKKKLEPEGPRFSSPSDAV
jgi:hypothetical protein